MISSVEIKKKAQKSYATFLSSLIKQEVMFPLEIKGNKSPGKTLEIYRKEMDDLLSSSNANKKYAYTIDCVKTKTRFIGSQSLPKHIYFANEEDYVGYLNKTAEVKKFKEVCDTMLASFPQFKEWMIKNPLKVNANLEVYPNPTNGDVTVQWNEDVSLIELTDMQGKVIQSLNVTGVKNTSIKLDGISSGLYLIRATSS